MIVALFSRNSTWIIPLQSHQVNVFARSFLFSFDCAFFHYQATVYMTFNTLIKNLFFTTGHKSIQKGRDKSMRMKRKADVSSEFAVELRQFQRHLFFKFRNLSKLLKMPIGSCVIWTKIHRQFFNKYCGIFFKWCHEELKTFFIQSFSFIR